MTLKVSKLTEIDCTYSLNRYLKGKVKKYAKEVNHFQACKRIWPKLFSGNVFKFTTKYHGDIAFSTFQDDQWTHKVYREQCDHSK